MNFVLFMLICGFGLIAWLVIGMGIIGGNRKGHSYFLLQDKMNNHFARIFFGLLLLAVVIFSGIFLSKKVNCSYTISKIEQTVSADGYVRQFWIDDGKTNNLTSITKDNSILVYPEDSVVSNFKYNSRFFFIYYDDPMGRVKKNVISTVVKRR
jgi:hypothetical protein